MQLLEKNRISHITPYNRAALFVLYTYQQLL